MFLIALGSVGCTSTEVLYKPIPSVYLQGCGEANLEGNTWADLAVSYKDAKDKLKNCNKQIKQIKDLNITDKEPKNG